MPFEKRFMRSKMWDPVGTRFLILRNKPSYFNFAFAWIKKKIRNQESLTRNQKSESYFNQYQNNEPPDFNFALPVKKIKISNQKSEIRYQNLEIRNQPNKKYLPRIVFVLIHSNSVSQSLSLNTVVHDFEAALYFSTARYVLSCIKSLRGWPATNLKKCHFQNQVKL